MAKKRMSIYGIIDILRAILAYNLVKYQYFSIRPGLFDKYHLITYSLQFEVQYQVELGFYVQKTFKKGPKFHFLNSRFIESVRYVLMYNLGYDKYFSINFLGVTQGNSADTIRAEFMAQFLQKILQKFCQKFLEAQLKNPALLVSRNFLV